MAELKGYIYDEIKSIAYQKKADAHGKVSKKYEKELDKVKQDAEKEITPKVLKAAQITVDLEGYRGMKIEVKIPEDIRKSLEDKYFKLKSVVRDKINKEQQRIEEKFQEWLCEFENGEEK